MPVDLSKPLAWKTATGDTSAMLSQLQPNIVKAHVREHMRILLVQFADKAEGRAFLKAVARKMKSAKKHLLEVERFKADGEAGTPYVGVGLTFEGYKKLGIATAKIPKQRLLRAVSRRRCARPRRSARSPTRRSRHGRSRGATRSMPSSSSATPRCCPFSASATRSPR